jgi:hypothetical protein
MQVIVAIFHVHAVVFGVAEGGLAALVVAAGAVAVRTEGFFTGPGPATGEEQAGEKNGG